MKNSQNIEQLAYNTEFKLRSKVINPNADGINDELELLYDVGNTNTLVKLILFEENGRFVKTLTNQKNIIHSGVLSWDIGIDERVITNGIYILVVETKTEKGQLKHIKLPFAILNDK